MQDISFPELIAPLSTADFLHEHWQKRTLWAPSSPRVRQLITLADVDFLLASLTTPGPNWMRLVKAGATLPERAYCTDETFVSLPKVYSAYQHGYTVQLSKMHKRWSPVGRLCRAVESALTEAGVPLAHRVGSHLYLTPPGSTGLDPHYDSHDVLVVQIEGVKRWQVYGVLEQFPIAMQKGMIRREHLPALEHDIRLQAGEILYIPRGVYHEAMTEETFSVHVTLDVFPYTWTDLVQRILVSHSAFREALPAGAWTADGVSPALVAGFRERMGWLVEFDGLGSLGQRMLGEFLDNLDTLPEDGFRQLHDLEAITLDTRLARRPGAMPRILHNGNSSQLRFPGSGFGGSDALMPVFRFLVECPQFAVRDLPELLADDSKLEIARELVREGFLKIAGQAP